MTIEEIVHMAFSPANPSSPLPKEQQSAVLLQLDSILRSPSFRRSNRYPAMLEYCVRHTIAGNLEQLRERQIGITLFSRPPGYDTSADPIVRMAAGEIRKRLAQFYDLESDDASVKISLPPGSYVAEFRLRDIAASTTDKAAAPDHGILVLKEEVPSAPLPSTDSLDEGRTVSPRDRPIPLTALGFIITLLLLVGVVGYGLWNRNVTPGFWQGALDGSAGHVILVVGQLPSSAGPQPIDLDPPLQTDIFRANSFVSVGDASSATAICSTTARTNVNCQLKPAVSTDLSNVQNRPAIFLGAYNNPWTLRIGASLPYRFGPLSCKCIVDAKSGKAIGVVDFSIPRDRISTDYSIVARFHSEVTDGSAVIVAGVGPMGTEAAAEFVSSAKDSKELIRLAPRGWKGGNVEVVLGTDVVNGIPGHTRIFRTAFW
jgi:hypothetical protein